MKKLLPNLLIPLFLIFGFSSSSYAQGNCFRLDSYEDPGLNVAPLCDDILVEFEIENLLAITCPNNTFDLAFTFYEDVFETIEDPILLGFMDAGVTNGWRRYEMNNVAIAPGDYRVYPLKFRFISRSGLDDNSFTEMNLYAKETSETLYRQRILNFGPSSGASSDGATITDLQNEGILNAIEDCDHNEDLVVDGNLLIDKDWCFQKRFLTTPPTNPNDFDQIRMLDGSSITVQSGNELFIERAVLDNCQSDWNGIIVESGASLVIREAIINGATIGITLLEGASLSIEQSQITNGNTGIFVKGNATVSLFENNLFDNLETGVLVQDASQIINLQASVGNENTFNTNTVGVMVDNSSAAIYHNFINSPIGIEMQRSTFTDIMHNNIAAANRGIFGDRSIFRAIQNTITGQDDFLNTGVFIRLSSMVDVIDNNITGRRGLFVSRSEEIDIGENEITAIGTASISSYGAFIFVSKTRMFNNTIKTDNATAGIQSRRSSGNLFENNTITGLNNANTSGIRLGASTNETVRKNVISGALDDGILVDNSSGNILECNDITAIVRGIYVTANSAVQSIKGNTLLAPIDLLTFSVLMPQIHHGNTFNGEYIEAGGLSTADVINSRFVIENGLADIPNFWFPAEFVELQLDANNETFYCSGEPGPGGIAPPNPECEHIKTVSALQKTNPEQYWIKAYHLYKYHLTKSDYNEWPNCLQLMWTDETICGLKELVKAEVALQAQIQGEKNSKSLRPAVAKLTGAYDKGANPETLKALLKNTQSSKDQYQSSLEKEVQQQLTMLASLECSHSLFSSWKKTYQLMLQQIQSEADWTTTELAELQATASLCLTAYGDVVHWARALISTVDDTRYDLIDNCPKKAESNVRADRAPSHKELITLHPNPAQEIVNIKGLGQTEDLRYELRDISGKLLASQNLPAHSTTISVANLAEGLYFVHVFDQKGFKQVIKLVVAR